MQILCNSFIFADVIILSPSWMHCALVACVYRYFLMNFSAVFMILIRFDVALALLLNSM